MSKILRTIAPMIIVFAWDVLINTPLGFYEVFSRLDIPMHLMGGFVTAWSGHRLYRLYYKKGKFAIQPPWLLAFVLIALTALITVIWEVYEFLVEPFVSIVMQWSVSDTVGDQIVGVLGAMLYTLTLFRFSKLK